MSHCKLLHTEWCKWGSNHFDTDINVHVRSVTHSISNKASHGKESSNIISWEAEGCCHHSRMLFHSEQSLQWTSIIPLVINEAQWQLVILDNWYRFSRPFSSPLHSILSGEAYCKFKSKVHWWSSNCHSHAIDVLSINFKMFSIQIRQLSLKFVCVARRVRNVGSNSSIKLVISNMGKFSILSFKFVKCYFGCPLHLGDEFDWNFDENECR